MTGRLSTNIHVHTCTYMYIHVHTCTYMSADVNVIFPQKEIHIGNSINQETYVHVHVHVHHNIYHVSLYIDDVQGKIMTDLPITYIYMYM